MLLIDRGAEKVDDAGRFALSLTATCLAEFNVKCGDHETETD